MKYLVTALALVFLAGCASKQEPFVPAPMPVELVNYSATQIVIPEHPSAEVLATVVEGDDVREALDVSLGYGLALDNYGSEMKEQLSICTVDNYELLRRQGEIKKFILLNQGPAQPGPN